MNLNSDSFYSHFVAPSTRFYNCRSTGLLQMTRILLALIVTLCYVEAFDLSWQTANARRTKVHPNQAVWSSSLIMVRYHIQLYLLCLYLLSTAVFVFIVSRIYWLACLAPYLILVCVCVFFWFIHWSPRPMYSEVLSATPSRFFTDAASGPPLLRMRMRTSFSPSK